MNDWRSDGGLGDCAPPAPSTGGAAPPRPTWGGNAPPGAHPAGAGLTGSQQTTLRVLWILYVVLGAMLLAVGLAMMAIGSVAAFAGAAAGHHGGHGPPGVFFAFLFWIYAVPLAVGGALGVLEGLLLRKRRNLTFCTVVAAISCAGIPWGTALGVVTLVMLSQPAVRAAFDRPGDSRDLFR
jgi:hypothetical protein